MSFRTLKRVYVILAAGLFLSFFGHGAWAAFENYEKFRELLSESLNNVFGMSTTIDDGWISTAVQGVGWFDIAVALTVVALAYGVIKGSGPLMRLASSPFAVAIFIWAAFWGFMTAASRITAAGDFYPAVWDFVERGPNFMVPAGLLYLTYILRRPTQLIEREELPMSAELVGSGK